MISTPLDLEEKALPVIDEEKTKEARQRLKESRAGIQNKHTESKTKKDEDLPINKAELLKPTNLDIEPINPEAVKRAYPLSSNPKIINSITQRLNLTIKEMEKEAVGQFFKEISIGYLDCLSDNKSNSIEEYINAAKFLSFRTTGDSLTRAYARTFPDRISRMQEEGLPTSYLHSYAQSYSKTVLVVKLQTAMAVPNHILFQDIFYQAVKTQAEIMTDVKVSPKVRSDAANSLMTHLKTPETAKLDIGIQVKESNILDQFTAAMQEMAIQQKGMLVEGSATIVDVSQQNIYEMEDHLED